PHPGMHSNLSAKSFRNAVVRHRCDRRLWRTLSHQIEPTLVHKGDGRVLSKIYALSSIDPRPHFWSESDGMSDHIKGFRIFYQLADLRLKGDHPIFTVQIAHRKHDS